MLRILRTIETVNNCKYKITQLNYWNIINRSLSKKKGNQRIKIRSTLYYITAAGVLTIGLSYAAVPLYRMFCQSYSYGGTTSIGHDTSKIETMMAIKHRSLTIKFNADTASSMRWNFKPQQNEITVCLYNGKILFHYSTSNSFPIIMIQHILGSTR